MTSKYLYQQGYTITSREMWYETPIIRNLVLFDIEQSFSSSAVIPNFFSWILILLIPALQLLKEQFKLVTIYNFYKIELLYCATKIQSVRTFQVDLFLIFWK